MPFHNAGPRYALHLFVLVTLALLTLARTPAYAADDNTLDPTLAAAQIGHGVTLPVTTVAYENGFAELKAKLDEAGIGDQASAPLTSEVPGDVPGTTIQMTVTGALFYYEPGGTPSFTPDAVHRWALAPSGGGLVAWEGDALQPPAPAVAAAAPSVSGPSSVGAYIVANAGWDAWHVACGESQLGLHMHNLQGSGASGYFQWMPGTAAGMGVQIGNLPSEVAGFNRMVAAGRRGEFRGYASYCPMP